MTSNLITFDEKLIDELKKLNLEYEKCGYMGPFVFIAEHPHWRNYDNNMPMKKPYVYSPAGIQRLNNLAEKSIDNEFEKGESNE